MTTAAHVGGWWRTLSALALVVGAIGALAACGSSGGSSTSPSASRTPFSPNPSAFSGSPPSALASLAASAQASLSAAASSLSAAASAFEASVSAEVGRNRAAAQSALASVSGGGNALSDVTITGLPKASSAGLNAAMVTIVNSTSSPASYAVKVNFSDASGAVVDSTVLGVENLAPGAKATPTAFTVKSPDQALVPTVAQAQRY